MKKLTVLFLTVCLAVSLVCTAGCGQKTEEKAKAKLVYWTMWNEAEPQGTVIA